MKLPHWSEALAELLAKEGHCGLLAAWTVLPYFRKRTAAARLVEACRYTKRHGVFTVCLAAALREHGLRVSFHSDPDPDAGALERRCYARACRLGIAVGPAIGLAELLRERRRGRLPIVFFNLPSNVGHFSPLLGVRLGALRLPLVDGGTMRVPEFLARWSSQGSYCTCPGPVRTIASPRSRFFRRTWHGRPSPSRRSHASSTSLAKRPKPKRSMYGTRTYRGRSAI